MKETESYMNAQFDIVHCHDWLAAKALVQMKQAGRRCILTMHSTEYGRCGNQNFEGNSAVRPSPSPLHPPCAFSTHLILFTALERARTHPYVPPGG